MRYVKYKNIKNRLYIATVCSECLQISEEYKVGIELDQFCMAAKMDGEGSIEAKQEISAMLRLGVKADAGEEESSDTVDGSDIAQAGTKTPTGLRRTLHAPFNELFPAAIDPEARALAMRRLQRAAELSRHYGADKMIVHSGYMPFVYFKEWHVEKSVEFWNELMADKPDDFKIVIENVLENEPYMMAEMMKQITNPNIRLCLDIGHANCISDVPVTEWLDVMAPYLGHLHIHNNDGSHDYHQPIHEGSIDIEAFIDRALTKLEPEATITIESLAGLSSMEWLAERGYI